MPLALALCSRRRLRLPARATPARCAHVLLLPHAWPPCLAQGDASKFEGRIGGLLSAFRRLKLSPEIVGRFHLMGGEVRALTWAGAGCQGGDSGSVLEVGSGSLGLIVRLSSSPLQDHLYCGPIRR
jgi:hypothetical protein